MAKRIQAVKFLRQFADDEKAAPQMKAIVASVIEDHGVGTPVTVEQIAASMEGNVTTRQPLARIFGYYAPKLEEAGLIEVERSEGAAPKSKKEKADKGENVAGDLDDESDEDEDLDDEDEDEDDNA
jgi:hypothetical protein